MYRIQPGQPPVPLFHKDIEPLLPGDFTVIIPVEIPLLRFREFMAQMPQTVELTAEGVLIYILRNINISNPAFTEYILRSVIGGVQESFEAIYVNPDPIIIKQCEVAVGAMINDIIEMAYTLNLFDEHGRFYYRPASINNYEVVLYDQRARTVLQT